jgi:uncharacterized protein (TIGR02145 family)
MKRKNGIWFPLLIIGVLIILINSCKKDKGPELTTSVVSEISGTTATCGGNITNDNGSSILLRGVCWSISKNPTTYENKTIDGNGSGSFTSHLDGLTHNTTYYVRAWAVNNEDIGYGNEQEFRTSDFPNCGTVIDIDGNINNTVIIGTQCWMRENLKVTRYRNGDLISNVTDDTTWSNLITGAYCDYNNIPSNIIIYGKLYNWYAISDSRNIAPSGYHVASDSEWIILRDYLGNNAGGKLKSLSYWVYPNLGASNESGFTALPSGSRLIEGTYSGLGSSGLWWTSSEFDTTDSWMKGMNYSFDALVGGHFNKGCGFSVRCLKN